MKQKRIYIVLCGLFLAVFCALSSFIEPKAFSLPVSPLVQDRISLTPLTKEEYEKNGTRKMKNSTLKDFRKLAIDVKGEHLGRHIITIPSIRELSDALTDDVVCFSSTEKQDNPKEFHLAYHLEAVLFVRNLKTQELKERLSPLAVYVSYVDEKDQCSVNCRYSLSQAVSGNHSSSFCTMGYRTGGRLYRLNDEPENEAEALVAEDFLCSIKGDFDRMSQMEAGTDHLRVGIQSKKEEFSQVEAPLCYVVHRLSSLQEEQYSETDRDWVRAAKKRYGLTSFQIVTAVYSAKWPGDRKPQCASRTLTRKFLVGTSYKNSTAKIYDEGMPIIIKPGAAK